MGPMILGLTATQISTLINDFTALWLSGSAEKGESFSLLGHVMRYPLWEGAVSHLFYAQRLYQLPLGLFGISLATAIFPEMSVDAAQQDFDALRRTISRGLRCTIFVALPATVGLLLISRPVVAIILERGEFTHADTLETAATLSFYVLGLAGYFAQQILTRAFYSLQESGVPARTAVIAVCVSLVLNLVLVWPLGSGGLAAATAICSYVQVAMLSRLSGDVLGPACLPGWDGPCETRPLPQSAWRRRSGARSTFLTNPRASSCSRSPSVPARLSTGSSRGCFASRCSRCFWGQAVCTEPAGRRELIGRVGV